VSFVTRHLDIQFQLAEGNFEGTNFNVIALSNIGASANISKNGTPSLNQLELIVRGMTLSQINQLSTLGKPLPAYRNNIVTVTAYDEGGPKTVVFTGTIQESWFDPNGIPDATFNVSAFGQLMPNVTPAPPVSYTGPTDVNEVMSYLATLMSLNFVNDGVSGVVLNNPYFAGTLMTQARACARAGNFIVDFDDNRMTILPKTGVKSGSPTMVSAETGMVGYPAHTDQGIAVTTLFNPNLVFKGAVQVKSTLTPANGLWAVFSLVHELEAGWPGASKWFTTFKANYYGGPTPIVG
jgi:hypothetical protein